MGPVYGLIPTAVAFDRCAPVRACCLRPPPWSRAGPGKKRPYRSRTKAVGIILALRAALRAVSCPETRHLGTRSQRAGRGFRLGSALMDERPPAPRLRK